MKFTTILLISALVYTCYTQDKKSSSSASDNEKCTKGHCSACIFKPETKEGKTTYNKECAGCVTMKFSTDHCEGKISLEHCRSSAGKDGDCTGCLEGYMAIYEDKTTTKIKSCDKMDASLKNCLVGYKRDGDLKCAGCKSGNILGTDGKCEEYKDKAVENCETYRVIAQIGTEKDVKACAGCKKGYYLDLSSDKGAYTCKEATGSMKGCGSASNSSICHRCDVQRGYFSTDIKWTGDEGKSDPSEVCNHFGALTKITLVSIVGLIMSAF